MPNPNNLFSPNDSPPQNNNNHEYALLAPPPPSESPPPSSPPPLLFHHHQQENSSNFHNNNFLSSPNNHGTNNNMTPSTNMTGDDDDDDPTHYNLRTPLLPSSSSSDSLPPPPEKLCVDEMLQKYCGEFGRWQMRHFLLTSLAWALEGFHTMVMIFGDRQPTWRCVGPPGSCPSVTGGAAAVCGMDRRNWEWIGGGSMSTVASWDLVCGDRYKVGLVQALFFSGCMIGAGIFGYLSDTSLGRKGSLTAVCILNSIFGCLTALSPTYPIYVFLRLLTGFSTGGVGLCAFVLATEPVGPSKRGVAGMSTFYFFGTGIALLSGIASVFPSWRTLYVASSIPSILFVLLVIPFVSESPRWYIIRGKGRQAMRVMRCIAETNGKASIPVGVSLALDGEQNRGSAVGSGIFGSFSITNNYSYNKGGGGDENYDGEVTSGSLWDVVKSDVTRKRLILAVVINFLCAVTYYGVSLNVVNLETNLYVNVLLNAIAEMPAFFLTAMMLDRFGRRPLAVGTLWFSGVFCLAGAMIGTSDGVWKQVRMVCGVLGIFGVAGTYNLLFIYTTELFPTVVRNAALGCATQAAQMGAILAPFIVVLGSHLPFAVFAGCGILGGLLSFLLPETLNRPLYDTMAGMEVGEAK